MATDVTSAPLDPTANSQSAAPDVQWDGDRMFNIYIYDYCIKRGFRKTANELVGESGIPANSQPPINAKQGLLFEWWSVFWVLFTAKSSGTGPEDALLYTQHQAQTQAPKTTRPNPHPGPPQAHQQQQRYPNGVRPPTQPGPQTNGIGPHPPQAGPLPNGTQSTVPFPGPMPQPNGVPGPSTGPPGSLAPPPGQNPPPHPNQRPMPPQQPRVVNGPPFQSPTMANSPPHAPGAAQPPNGPMGAMGGVGTNPPLTQMRSGNMLPPNRPPPGPMGSAQQAPQPAYQQQLGRSPSNPASPAGNNLPGPSPSMAHRIPPGAPGMGSVPNSPEVLNAEISRIPPQLLMRVKIEAGFGDKDMNTMSVEEKHHVVQIWRTKVMSNTAGPSMSSNMQPPSALRNSQGPPPAHPGQPQPPMAPQAPGQQQRAGKRMSSSPGQEPDQLPGNDGSPNGPKRQRRSPPGADGAQPPMYPLQGPSSMQPPMQQSMQQGNTMMRGPPMQMSFATPPMAGLPNPNMMNHGMGTPQMASMNPPMNSGMMGGPQGTPQAMQQYRQTMATMHNKPHLQSPMPGPVGSPSADGQGGAGGMPGGPPPGGPQPRMGQQKPPMAGMMPPPPPSPAMAAKVPMKVEDGSGAPNGRMDASPQNAPGGIPSGPSTSTPTPTPHTPSASGMTAPSPSAIMSSTPTMPPAHPHSLPQQPPPQQAPLPPAPSVLSGPADSLDTGMGFPLDFGVDSLDPNFFTGETSLNFERDFAAWFDPESAA